MMYWGGSRVPDGSVTSGTVPISSSLWCPLSLGSTDPIQEFPFVVGGFAPPPVSFRSASSTDTSFSSSSTACALWWSFPGAPPPSHSSEGAAGAVSAGTSSSSSSRLMMSGRAGVSSQPLAAGSKNSTAEPSSSMTSTEPRRLGSSNAHGREFREEIGFPNERTVATMDFQLMRASDCDDCSKNSSSRTTDVGFVEVSSRCERCLRHQSGRMSRRHVLRAVVAETQTSNE